MTKNISFLLLLLAMVFVGCTKDDNGGKKDDNTGKDVITMTADINEIDGIGKWSFKGGGENDYVGAKSEMGDFMLIYFFATEDLNDDDYMINVKITRKDGSTAKIAKKEYTLNDPDFHLSTTLYYMSDPHQSYSGGEVFPGYEEEREYNGEPATSFARLNVTKLGGGKIEADFEFDAYTPGVGGAVKKVTVRNGKIKGRTIGGW